MLALYNSGLDLVPASRVEADGAEWGLAAGPRIVVLTRAGATNVLNGLEGEARTEGGDTLLVGPLTARNAAALRRHLPWLAPRPLGLQTSAGMGDRLGLATPGHVRAMLAAGRGLAPIFAQQSIREMTRTGRTPQQVLDDATWGAFEGGWRSPVGADADHLKTTADIDACLAAGFSFFTVDPSEHVDARADAASATALRTAVDALPWAALEDDPTSARVRYVGRVLHVGEHRVACDEVDYARAAMKYGRAVVHVVRMFRHLEAVSKGHPFELEVSVDETDSPTSPAEHYYVASELRRLGVRWVSLAPRFVGRFEKGVDYIGDLGAFETQFAVHAAIARHCGPYKLSLHSGSDKFSIYPITAVLTRGLVHLKTAGTSYLEALRAIARASPPLFREIYEFARERYDTDRLSYHVSAQLDRAPRPDSLDDTQLASLLEDFNARQILHVTFGSVLRAAGRDGRPSLAERVPSTLRAHAPLYADCLETHFTRHLAPFSASSHPTVTAAP